MPLGHTVTIRSVDDKSPLISQLARPTPHVCWLRRGEGMIGWGLVASHTCGSAAEAEAWWRDFVRSARVIGPNATDRPPESNDPEGSNTMVSAANDADPNDHEGTGPRVNAPGASASDHRAADPNAADPNDTDPNDTDPSDTGPSGSSHRDNSPMASSPSPTGHPANSPIGDLTDEPMAGPVAFISFPFAPDGEYEVVVPQVVHGSRNGHSWEVRWDCGEAGAPTSEQRSGTSATESSFGVPSGISISVGCPCQRPQVSCGASSGSAEGEKHRHERAQATPVGTDMDRPSTSSADGDPDGMSAIPVPPVASAHSQRQELADSPTLTFRTGNLDREHWLAAVSAAVARIQSGELEKVVLARDEIATSTTPIDASAVLAHLADQYPQTWTFYVKGLVGASPELLVRQDRGLITSRVLAGTIAGEADDAALAQALSSSSKDLAEHEYAVASVAAGLRPHVTSLHVPEVPFVLRLPNVMHLASDITGAAKPGATVVSLAAAIHPSAAVCGTPTQAARRVITELEHMDRGRYAGPVGWVNASGDGEIALALRCGHITASTARIFAGCGIVAESDPEAEWNETVAKLRPMKQALGLDA